MFHKVFCYFIDACFPAQFTYFGNST